MKSCGPETRSGVPHRRWSSRVLTGADLPAGGDRRGSGRSSRRRRTAVARRARRPGGRLDADRRRTSPGRSTSTRGRRRPEGYDASALRPDRTGADQPEARRPREGVARAVPAGEPGYYAGRIPADAVTASASGLDPHISPANADIQAGRVAQARKRRPPRRCAASSARSPRARWLGFIGEPRVNVLRAEPGARRAVSDQ